MEEKTNPPQPLSDEYILDRLSELSLQIIHLKTHFDTVLSGFQMFVNLEEKLRQQEEKHIALYSIQTSVEQYNSEMTNLSKRIQDLEIEVYAGKPIEPCE